MTLHDFNKKLREGNMCEERVKTQFKVIFEPVLTHIMFDSQPDKQRNGIDFEISRRPMTFDVKCRNAYAYKYGDILLETMSVVENDKLGWLYTSHSDIIVYAWNNPNNTMFVDGYLLYMESIRKWLADKNVLRTFKVRNARSYRGGVTWTTSNIAVPITAFPHNCIHRIDTDELNPADREAVSNWFEVRKN